MQITGEKHELMCKPTDTVEMVRNPNFTGLSANIFKLATRLAKSTRKANYLKKP
jgi:hypothetical protein